jgi:hypothetical protein
MSNRLRFVRVLWLLCTAICLWTDLSPAFSPIPAAPVATIRDASLTISQPRGAAVKGVCRLAVSTSDKTIASVEYRLGSRRLGIVTQPPFTLNWNTAYAADGSSAVQAIGRDSLGKVVAAAQRIFTIKNRGNSMDLAGSTLPSPLRGVAALSFSGYDSRYYPAVWLGYIDGELLGTAWTDNRGRHDASVTMRLDTTRFTNGRHELYVAMHSDYWQPGHPEKKSFHNYRGAFERVVDIENGHTLMDVAANYLHVHVRPGQRIALTCRQLFTDGGSGPCAQPVYSSSDRAVVNVSAGGVLTAGTGQGFAAITVADSGKTTAVEVWVRKHAAIAHFAGNGRIVNSYRAGQSLFVVAPFVLQPSDLKGNPALIAEVRRAGINTLSRGFYANPRNVHADYQAWMKSFYGSTAPDWLFARDNGFHILGTGDEVARNIGGEAWWTLNWPHGREAVQYAMTLMASSGVAIAADMVDEASMMWGATPRPAGKVGAPKSFTSISCSGMKCTVRWAHNPVTPKRFPSGASFALDHSVNHNLNTPLGRMFTAVNIGPDSFDFTPAGPLNGTFTAANDPNLEFVWWAGNIGGCPAHPCIPPVPNSALTDITRWIHTAPRSVPVSWPVLGIAPAVVQGNWMGRGGISDYASHYWDSFNLRHTYPWSGGVQEFTYWMRQLFYQRQPLMMLERPQIFLGSISSFMYVKRTPGAAYYTPPADESDTPGCAGPAVTSTIMTAAALGGAGVRLYQFEPPGNLPQRVKAPVGTTLQTGASPLASDPVVRENWRAMAYAANPLTKTLAPCILGTALNSPAYGRNIVTGARQCPGMRMLMVINDNDWPRTVPIDLTPYSSGRPATRYQIGYDGISTDLLRNARSDTLTLAEGETAVYLFPASGRVLQPIALKPPARHASPRVILHYGYIYKESVPASFNGRDCTNGCTLNLDRSLGPIFYQFTGLDSAGNVMDRSPIEILR